MAKTVRPWASIDAEGVAARDGGTVIRLGLLNVRGFRLLVGFGLLRGRLGRLGLLSPGKPAQLLDGGLQGPWIGASDDAAAAVVRLALSKNMKVGIAVTPYRRATSWAASTLTLTKAREPGRQ
ncbi:hypothetical protein ColKHC_05064 [Colletotrichum higginsianum]|nr:hypothetical protein ColKHC_05064 [Colletotrichum higginsianum]